MDLCKVWCVSRWQARGRGSQSRRRRGTGATRTPRSRRTQRQPALRRRGICRVCPAIPPGESACRNQKTEGTPYQLSAQELGRRGRLLINPQAWRMAGQRARLVDRLTISRRPFGVGLGGRPGRRPPARTAGDGGPPRLGIERVASNHLLVQAELERSVRTSPATASTIQRRDSKHPPRSRAHAGLALHQCPLEVTVRTANLMGRY